MSDLSKRIEHTLLKPDCTQQDIRKLCEEALQYGFAGVCVPPYHVREARRIIGEENPIRVVTVIGFPMGYSAIAAKSEEIKRAIEDGADDVDAVLNIAAVKSGNWNHVNNDLDSIARSAQMRGKTLKLILECGLLSDAEIAKVCALAAESGISFLKTGTGYHGHPASVEMVRQLIAHAQPGTRIKASGGIRTTATALALVDAGADLIGTSSSLEIIDVQTTA